MTITRATAASTTQKKNFNLKIIITETNNIICAFSFSEPKKEHQDAVCRVHMCIRNDRNIHRKMYFNNNDESKEPESATKAISMFVQHTFVTKR